MKTIKISDDSYEVIKSQLKDEEKIVEKKKVNIEIKNRWTGDIIYSSEKTTMKEAVEESVKSEADLSKADLSKANLFEANLFKADLYEAKFWGKTNIPIILKENQIDDFLGALGFKRK